LLYTRPAAPSHHPLSLHDALPIFLKSALLKRGYVPADLRRFDNRHNLRALLELLKKKGLPVSAEATSIIEGLSPQHAHHLLRYQDRKSTRLNSSHEWISYAVFCLK